MTSINKTEIFVRDNKYDAIVKVPNLDKPREVIFFDLNLN